MEASDTIALWALVVAALAFIVSSVVSALAARYAARSAGAAEISALAAQEALANMRTQTAIAREGVETAQSVRDREDRPRFRMTPDPTPSSEQWWIEVEMVDGPTRVQARWLHQGEVHGPRQPIAGSDRVARDVSLVLGERGGPLFLHKGATFRVGVECDADSTGLNITVSVTTVELAPGTDDRPTGRQWSHIEAVAIERPPPPNVW